MVKGIYYAAAGMLPRANQQEVVANNLANVNTTGFKGDRRFFRRVLDSSLVHQGIQGERGVMDNEIQTQQTDFIQGSFSQTRNPLDIAISGEGFFALETGETVSYTRNGNFFLNEDGEIVNSRAYKVLGEDGPIKVAGNEVIIKDDGQVMVDGSSAGTLKIVKFEQMDKLFRNGYGYFIPDPPQEAVTPEDLNIRQGFLENSNVEAVLEMVLMIELNRNYESCQKSIIAQDETLRMAANQIAG